MNKFDAMRILRDLAAHRELCVNNPGQFDRHGEYHAEVMNTDFTALYAALTKQVDPQNGFRKVILESPYAGDVERNVAYLNRAIRYCIERGASPYASHQMLTGALDDTEPYERAAGIQAGLVWGEEADQIWVFTDYGISPGMQRAIEYHQRFYRSIVYKRIGENT